MITNAYDGKKVFISYSHRDKKFVERITNDLENQGLHAWVDEKEIKVGDSISKELEEGISKADFFCLVISKNSAQSKWVEREYRLALNKQLSSGGIPKILPILMDDTQPPEFFRDIKYADFSKSYNNGLQLLLKAIGAFKHSLAADIPTHDALLADLKTEPFLVNDLFQDEKFLEEFRAEIEKNWTGPKLKSSTKVVLRTLQIVIQKVSAAKEVLSPLKRSKIAEKAIADLNQIIADGEEVCSLKEWTLIKKIAQKWLDILDKSGWVFEKGELRKDVENPYKGHSGLPVTDTTFRGRADIIRRIARYWGIDKNFPTLILYGHGRMGKTSILKYLERHIESSIIFVYLSIHKVGKISNTGQLLFHIARYIHSSAGKVGLSIAPPNAVDYTDMGCYDTFSGLMDKLVPHMISQKCLVLAIDEFEVIEKKIREKKIDAEFIPYLQSIIRDYNWLGGIFAVVHTHEKILKYLRSSFYKLRVGLLKREDSFRLIAFPRPGFTLEYSPELLKELYRLTSGQPLLIQRLCWELVTRWNERFDQQGVKTSRTLTMDDLPDIITPDFLESAEFYFDGVWDNVTEGERILMCIMAKRQEGTWTLDELADVVKTYPSLEKVSTLKETFDLLKRHDVIIEENGNVRFAGELMRCWVDNKKLG